MRDAIAHIEDEPGLYSHGDYSLYNSPKGANATAQEHGVYGSLALTGYLSDFG